MSKWIRFTPFQHAPAGIKTKQWNVLTLHGDGFLGLVKWLTRWRKYCFFPAAGTAYEEDCLRDIATFCQEQTAEHKGSRTTAPKNDGEGTLNLG